MTITVTLNGKAEDYQPGTTVHALVAQHGWSEQAIAVAVDGAVVPRGRWRHSQIDDGADITILSPMQGG